MIKTMATRFSLHSTVRTLDGDILGAMRGKATITGLPRLPLAHCLRAQGQA